jgi:multiple sugar transport system permease protein
MGGKNGLRLAALLLLAALFLFPLIWIFFTSLKSEIEVRSTLHLLPTQWHWDNYIDAWQASNFARQFLNSFIMALSVTFGQLLTSFLAGYAFARLKFKMRRVLFTAFITTLIVPYQLLVLPIFIMFSKLGWIDTYAALILPTLANAFGIFLFKQHFVSIPVSLEESAQIDGASRWKTLWQILFPLSRTPAVTLFLLTFIFEWNDLFKPLVFTQSAEMRTVQLGLMAFQEHFKTSYTLLTAAVVFVTVPVILLFFIGQRQFLQGIAATGSKEV